MKKVAIITITNSGLNFGNRLQNYALQERLERLGAETETIFAAKGVKNSLLLSKIRRFIKQVLKNSGRRKCFDSFNKQFIKKSDVIRYEKINDHVFADKYDAFVAGSDQVWNPNFHFNSDFEFAAFAPKEKRFSYAASIGVSDIPEDKREDFVRLLKEMNMISVREEDAVGLVERLSGRKAFLNIDPTMLLKSKDYEKLEKKPEGIDVPEHYVLKYYLGNVLPEYEENIEQIGKELGLPVEYLSESEGTKYYNIGPSEFLYMLRHADYICTDSFHGSVFSILFHKRFTVYVRKDNDVPMNSRIDTLLGMTGLQNRLYGEQPIDKMLEDISYEAIDSLLDEKRREADEYFNEMYSRWK